MKLLTKLFIAMGLGAMVVGIAQKFFGRVMFFESIKPVSHLVFANTCFLIALILKVAND